MSLHLPIHTNAFKLLLEMCMFFVINSILLMFDFCFQQKLLEKKTKTKAAVYPGFSLGSYWTTGGDQERKRARSGHLSLPFLADLPNSGNIL